MSVVNYFTKSRVEAFSDGVFAIIVTLLVLEIKVPHIENGTSIHELGEALWHIVPKFVAWVISFLIVGVIWVNHHRIFESLKEIDHGIFWLNANLLLWTSFIPFPTALLGDYPRNQLAVSFFGAAGFMMGVAFVILRFYMWKKPEITNGFTKEYLWKGVRNAFLFGPALYLAAALTAWIHPFIAFAIYAFIPVYFIFPKATALQKRDE